MNIGLGLVLVFIALILLYTGINMRKSKHTTAANIILFISIHTTAANIILFISIMLILTSVALISGLYDPYANHI
ncbi:hypothetical protein C1N73_28225 (plasmid) [Priestia aryabhattai]